MQQKVSYFQYHRVFARSIACALIAALSLIIFQGTSAAAPAYEQEYDLNSDGIIDVQDIQILATHLGAVNTSNRQMDLNQDSRIDAFDLSLVAQHNGAQRPAGTPLDFDVNGDGSIDGADLSALESYLSPASYQPRYDFTQDGRIDAFDLGALARKIHEKGDADEPSGPQLFAPPQTVLVDVGARLGVHIDMGGNNSNPNRQLSYAVDRNGWADVRKSVLDPLAQAGVRRMELHNVLGRRNRSVPMDFPIWDELRQTLPALVSDFVSEFSDFHRRNPQVESVAYLGSPYKTPELAALESTPEAWWDTVLDTLIPVFQAGFTSIGFDATGSSKVFKHPLDLLLHEVLMNPAARDPVRDRRLIDVIGSWPIRVYFEATPQNGTDPRTGLYTDRSEFGHVNMIITDYDYYAQDPERSGTHPSRKRHSERYGEMEEIGVIVRGTSCAPDDPGQPRAHCLRSIRALLGERYGNTVALVPPRFLVYLPANHSAGFGANQKVRGHSFQPDLAAFVEELDLKSLPARVDLDRENRNPEEAVFTVTRNPLHGSFQMSSQDPDVLVYFPHNEFAGSDYLEYSVSTQSGSVSGRINFEVR